MKHIILISGKLQSGKNQLAEYLMNEFKKHNLSCSPELFAKGVKDGCKEDYKQLTIYLNNIAEEIKGNVLALLDGKYDANTIEKFSKLIDSRLKTYSDNWYENKTPITKILLQSYGTDIFRKRVNNNWWAIQTKNRIDKINSDVVVLTDCRFPEEINVFLDNKKENEKIITVRINRNININNNISNHESETSLDTFDYWNYIVDNKGSLNDLKQCAINIVGDLLIDSNDDTEMDINLKIDHLIGAH